MQVQAARQDWQVILRSRSGHLVLHNSGNDEVTVARQRNRFPTRQTPHIRSARCPTCLRSWPLAEEPADTYASVHEVDEAFAMPQASADYFKLLSQSLAGTPSSSRPPTPPHDDTLPSSIRIDKYYETFFVQERLIGTGHSSQVYLCRHVLNGIDLGHYAVKRIAIGNSSKRLRRFLESEVKRLETLRGHPNVVTLAHVWIEMSAASNFAPSVPTAFMLMMYANGGSLESYVAQRRGESSDTARMSERRKAHRARHLLNADEIISLFSDISHGLEHLHVMGVLHLDLKAANVLLHCDGEDATLPRAMLSDFGESELRIQRDARHQRSGYTGTLDYLAPEAMSPDDLTGRLAELNSATDLWSLGLLLYLLIYLELPYRSQTREELVQEIKSYPGYSSDPNDHLHSSRADLPRGLFAILSKLLSRTPHHRPSAAIVLAAIAALDLADIVSPAPRALAIIDESTRVKALVPTSRPLLLDSLPRRPSLRRRASMRAHRRINRAVQVTIGFARLTIILLGCQKAHASTYAILITFTLAISDLVLPNLIRSLMLLAPFVILCASRQSGLVCVP